MNLTTLHKMSILAKAARAFMQELCAIKKKTTHIFDKANYYKDLIVYTVGKIHNDLDGTLKIISCFESLNSEYLR